MFTVHLVDAPRFGYVACLLLAASAVPASAAQISAQAECDTLIRLEKDWNDALYRKDVASIERVLADEFIATYEDGSRGDKAAELKFTADFDQQVRSAVQDGFTVRTYGDTAVVWFTLHLEGIRQGQPTELTLRYTDVWIKRDGRWQCVSAQSTRVEH